MRAWEVSYINKIKDVDKIKVIDKSEIFYERENSITHTAFETEVMFYGCIKNGDCEMAEKMMHRLLSQSVITGKMSDDPIRQMKYWAVCCITLAIRYAISGGLDETTAYNYSDKAIYKIDHMNTTEEIFVFLKSACIDLTRLVAKSKEKTGYPNSIRKCIRFINANLHDKLSLDTLSGVCEISPDYLSSLFKKTTGQTVTSYIKERRLEAAKQMLQKEYATSEVAYYLGFCSESYFIKCFKEQYGITPKKYLSSLFG